MDMHGQTCMMVMHNDPFENMLNFMDPQSIHKIYQTCKYYNKYLRSFREKIIMYAIKNIDTRLKNIFGPIYDDLINIMRCTNSVISGSFIIQSILDEYWEGTDIDIFVPLIGNQTTMSQHGNILTQMDTFMLKYCNHMSYEASDRYGHGIGPDIKWVRTFSIKNSPYTIQLILVDVKNDTKVLSEYIEKTFDFDICKNIYCYNLTRSEPELSIKKLGNILTKTEKFEPKNNHFIRSGEEINTIVEGSYKRCDKYAKRGFNFNHTPHEKKLVEMMRSRLERYARASRTVYKIKTIEQLPKNMSTFVGDNYKSYKLIKYKSYKIMDKYNWMFVDGDILTLDMDCKKQCHFACGVANTTPNLKHYHYNGIHRKRGVYDEYIFVVVE